MRVRLKGVNSITKSLADGSKVTYHYAWKGGPRLEGKPGSPEFIASFNAAASKKIEPKKGTLAALFTMYENSAQFDGLAQRTKADYVKIITRLEDCFGTFPISGLEDRRSRAIFEAWRDELAKKSRRQADYAWTVFARILSVAKKRRMIETNPLEQGGRLYDENRAESVWSDEDEANFLKAASPEIALAFMLAIWTGQRQGDLLRLPWSGYDGSYVKLRQSKTGVKVRIPVSAKLKVALDSAPKVGPLILTSSDKRPWTSDGFRSSWKKTAKRAKITGLTFHDLRGTAVTRLAVAGCTEAEIISITGHTLSDVRTILDVHYLHRDPQLAANAIAKLEKRRTDFPN